MKVAWASLKIETNIRSVTVKLAFGRDIIAVTEYRKSFCESDQSAYQERQQSLMI